MRDLVEPTCTSTQQAIELIGTRVAPAVRVRAGVPEPGPGG